MRNFLPSSPFSFFFFFFFVSSWPLSPASHGRGPHHWPIARQRVFLAKSMEWQWYHQPGFLRGRTASVHGTPVAARGLQEQPKPKTHTLPSLFFSFFLVLFFFFFLSCPFLSFPFPFLCFLSLSKKKKTNPVLPLKAQGAESSCSKIFPPLVRQGSEEWVTPL